MTVGFVHKLESFGLVDGPGVRFVVFLQGCRMRCRYCHNPETWKLSAGTPMSPEELFSKAIRYKSYWKNNGGVTVSGGEPLLQLDFLTEFFEICRAHSVHTALDTSGNPFEKTPEYLAKWDRLLNATSLVLLDLKMLDARAHQELTGKPNENILQIKKFWLPIGPNYYKIEETNSCKGVVSHERAEIPPRFAEDQWRSACG